MTVQRQIVEPQPFLVLPDEVHPVSFYRIARPFVRAFHYLHRPPTGCRLSLGVFAQKRLLGVMIFGRPVARLEDQLHTLELTRMVLWPSPKNSESRALGMAERFIRGTMPDVHRLIAYADPDQNHTGTIYLAANWNKLGTAGRANWSNRKNRITELGGRKVKFERLIR